jgi:5'-3' exonuclease
MQYKISFTLRVYLYMGIPYYFATLIRKNKGLVSRVDECLTPDILAIDFNCLIHQYMDDTDPVQSIIKALRLILKDVCSPTRYIYIAMDGLVPYAKMVQQRYRRFRIPEKEGIFDRHQISPQTPYMVELANAVREAFPSAIVSDTSEPGEGEHKLLNWLKTLPKNQRKTVTVYGLDADLILLCLSQKELSAPNGFTLLRENTTFNKETEGFSSLSIWKLAQHVEIPIQEYIHLCVLCFGNDFMPSLALFSLREGGHDRALKYYKECRCSLLTPQGRSVFLKHAQKHEKAFLIERVQTRQRNGERAIVTPDAQHLKERYNAHILDGVQDIQPVVEAFWKTFDWTVSYFTKNHSQDWGWYYPYVDAPLLCQIVDYPEKTPVYQDAPVKVQQQLQFILPACSLRKTKKRVAFPDEYYSEERMPWMKRYAWESKPRISLPWNPSQTETRIEPWVAS